MDQFFLYALERNDDMQGLKKILEEKVEWVKKRFIGIKVKDALIGSEAENSLVIQRRQKLYKLLLLIGIVLGFFVILMFLGEKEKQNKTANQDSIEEKENYKKIEFATSATKGEVKWQNFLEEEVEKEKKSREEEISLLRNALESTKEETKSNMSNELGELKARLSYALGEIDRLKIENKNIQNDIESLSDMSEEALAAAEIGITTIEEEVRTRGPVSSYNNIPATSYVSGHLLGGIAVSTSVSSSAEPIPVVIKLTSKGNLPKNFAMDIKQCRILGSAYGDISSERAIIRAEELICENKAAGLITSTKVAGVIYGDDGANGIHGSVISM